MREEEFLSLYRTLEHLLSQRPETREAKRFQSPIMAYLHSAEGKLFREELDLCREIRNILVHSPEIGGQAIIEPSAVLVECLKEIIEHVKRPPLALNYATPAELIFSASLSDNALRTMRRMQRDGFSHLPIFENGLFFGVFSVSTLFSDAVEHGGCDLNADTKLDRFRALIPIHTHRTEQFLFLPKTANYFEARVLFERPTKHDRRLAAIFITKSGDPKDRLLGMITPWDVLDDEEFQQRRNKR